ncbi:ABC transporter ATP-binding protein [Infirmifilum lucidum]|uniref:ABC transporter ATP-binding protein n=1 Tax=Infirmifilum lucidum TaxID=2776706 RepID=A0A7L9FH53_9CREN|nr:ATP-binding cassette domain-containing protein [Infirmifilum lucidum]QOJ79089.1 ABC transporter ATP-binding protein [Infirmifilum lucidum]
MLSVDSLVAGYSGNPVIGPVSFSLQRGEALLVTGPNGVGKTTLLKTIATVLKPLSGSMTLFGADIRKQRRRIFFLEERVNLPLSLTPVEYLRVIGSVYGVDADFTGLPARFGVPRGTPMSKFSQGQRRRVQLAGAYVASKSADLIILDDPLVGLDDYSVEALVPLLVSELLEQGRIVVVSTKMRELERLLSERIPGRLKILDALKYTRVAPKLGEEGARDG